MVAKDDDVPVTAVRPFLANGRGLGRSSLVDTNGIDAGAVRAYAMTRGRSHAAVHLAFETMLQATMTGMDVGRVERFERADILSLCRTEPLSVAELSARMRIPIGVVRVVAADLLLEGHLEAFQPTENVADDVLLIARLIAGVRAL